MKRFLVVLLVVVLAGVLMVPLAGAGENGGFSWPFCEQENGQGGPVDAFTTLSDARIPDMGIGGPWGQVHRFFYAIEMELCETNPEHFYPGMFNLYELIGHFGSDPF